jgi:REP element-mobilizing transposase RayT
VFHCRFGTAERAQSLRDPRACEAIVEALRFHQDLTAEILAYCIMPDHVHLLLSLRGEGKHLARLIGDFKRWVGREYQRRTAQELHWQSGFFEHVVRSHEDLRAIAEYILANPVRAGLAASWRDYRWCGSLSWQL